MKSISLDFHFKSPIEKVWFALTDSNTLSKWMFFKENDFKPVVGHKFQFRMEPTEGWNGIVEGEVLEVDEPHRLSYKWVSAGVSTTVTWTLKQDEDGTTHLHLDQTGFEEVPEQALDQALNGAKYGWQSMAKQLENVLAEL